MAQITSISSPQAGGTPQVQVVALDSRKQEQVVSDKQYLKILQLTDLLARNLEVARVLQVFSNEIGLLVPHSGFSFESRRFHHALRVGVTEQHSLTYHLTVDQMKLGDFSVYRNKPFGSNEVCQLEDLLCALVYPLKNALMYHAALVSARHDPLTGAFNRGAMDQLLEREVSLAQRHQLDLSLLMVDLDGFKQINDRLGHAAGDEVLRQVADTISHRLRDSDVLCRYGGDEFVVVLPQTSREGSIEVAQRVLDGIRRLILQEDLQGFALSASLGLASLKPKEGREQLFARADQAMYQAKQQGKDQMVTVH